MKSNQLYKIKLLSLNQNKLNTYFEDILMYFEVRQQSFLL